MTGSERHGARYRLRRLADFQRVYDRRRSASDAQLLAFGCENGLDYPRLGVSVSRKVGGAVVRNRWKRRLRDAFRTTRSELPRGIDLVLIPRAATEPDFAALQQSLVALAARVAAKIARDAV